MKKIILAIILMTTIACSNQNQRETLKVLIYALIDQGQNVLADDIIEYLKDSNGSFTDNNGNSSSNTTYDSFRSA